MKVNNYLEGDIIALGAGLTCQRTTHLAVVLQERAAASDVVDVQHYDGEGSEAGERAGDRCQKRRRGACPVDLRNNNTRSRPSSFLCFLYYLLLGGAW